MKIDNSYQLKLINSHIRDYTIFLIGSGESIRKYHSDLTWLNSRNLAVTNSNLKLFPSPDFLFYSDPQWQKNNTFVINNLTSATMLFNFSFNPELWDWSDINPKFYYNTLKIDSLDGFSETEHTVCGNNTGSRALNFLAHFKPKNIILVGFDLQGNNWHGKYPKTEDKYHDQFLENFEQMAPYLKNAGINVYNANTPKYSRLRCFEFTDIREWSDEGDKTDWWKE